MAVENELQYAADMLHLLCGERLLPIAVREAAGFDEADMARGESGVQREIELTDAARGSPVAKQLPHGVRLRAIRADELREMWLAYADHATAAKAGLPLPRT